MNKFQSFMTNKDNKQIAFEIAKLYHTDIEPNKLEVSYTYDWVTIKGKDIAIGIEFVIPFFGMGWQMNDFVRVYNTSHFRAWRFYDDSKCAKDKIEHDNPDINQILANYNTPRPTPTEMFKYYYSD